MAANPDEYGGRRTACSILHQRLLIARSQNGEVPIRRVWATTLGVGADELVRVIRGIAETADLATAARAEVDMHLDPMLARETAKVWQNLDQLFAFDNLGAPWRHVSNLLEPPTLDVLKYAHLSIRELGAHRLPPEHIAAFRKQLYALLERINGANELDATLRAVLSALLSQALRVLDEYEIGGPAATEAAAQRVAGLVLQHQEMLTRNEASPHVRETMNLTARAVAITAWANQNQGMVALLLGIGGIVGAALMPIATPTLSTIGENIAGFLANPNTSK